MNANTADTDFASASAMPSYGVHSVVAKSTFDALIKQIEQAVKLANEIVHKDIRAQAAETMEIVTRSTIDNTNVWLEISHVNHDYAKLYELLDTVVTCASHYLATLQDLPRSAFVTACLVQVPVLAALIERCFKLANAFGSVLTPQMEKDLKQGKIQLAGVTITNDSQPSVSKKTVMYSQLVSEDNLCVSLAKEQVKILEGKWIPTRLRKDLLAPRKLRITNEHDLKIILPMLLEKIKSLPEGTFFSVGTLAACETSALARRLGKEIYRLSDQQSLNRTYVFKSAYSGRHIYKRTGHNAQSECRDFAIEVT